MNLNNLILKELKKEGVTFYIYSINNILISLNIILDNKIRKSNLDHITRSFHSELLYQMFDKSSSDEKSLDNFKLIINNFIKNYNKNTNYKVIQYNANDFHAFELARSKIENNEYQIIKFYLYQYYPYNPDKDTLYFVKKKNDNNSNILQVSDQYYLKPIKKAEENNRNLFYLSPRWELGLNDYVLNIGRIGKRNNSQLFDIYKLELRDDIKNIYINTIHCPYIKNRNNNLSIYSVFIDDTLELIHDSICSINNDVVLRLIKIEN